MINLSTKWITVTIFSLIILISILFILYIQNEKPTPAEGRTAFEKLLQNTQHSDSKVRLRSMDSLEKMLEDHPARVDRKKLFMQMADVLSDNDPYVRYKAVTIFGYLGNPEAITCLKKFLAQETDPRVRSKTTAVIKYLSLFNNK